MACIGIVNGQILSVYWFRDENGDATNVNGKSYVRMLKDHVSPRIQGHQYLALQVISKSNFDNFL